MPTERRRQPRIQGDFPAVVRGRSARGQRFEQRTQICNLSTTGLHLRPLQDIAPGMKLFIVFRLALTWAEPGLTVATHSIVRRVEPGGDGGDGVAVEFQRYRCLYVVPNAPPHC